MTEIEKRINDLEKTEVLTKTINECFEKTIFLSKYSAHISVNSVIKILKEIIEFGENETLEIKFCPYSSYDIVYSAITFPIYVYSRKNIKKIENLPDPDKILFLKFHSGKGNTLDDYYSEIWRMFSITLVKCATLINKKYKPYRFTTYSPSIYEDIIFINLENITDPLIILTAEPDVYYDEIGELIDSRFVDARIPVEPHELQYLLRNRKDISDVALKLLKKSKEEHNARIDQINKQYLNTIDTLTDEELLLLEIN